MSFPCGCSLWMAVATWLGALEFNQLVRNHYLHTIMKLELESKRQVSRPPAPDEEPSPTTSRAAWQQHRVRKHRTSRSSLPRTRDGSDAPAGCGGTGAARGGGPSGSSASLDSGGDGSLGVCILEEPLAVPEELCPGLTAPISPRLSCPQALRGAVFCQRTRTTRRLAVNSPSYLNSGPLVYYQVWSRVASPGVKGEPGRKKAHPPSPREKDSELPSPVTSLVA